jgi:hypothetical protein
MARPFLSPHPENATITNDQQAPQLAQLIDQPQQAQRSFWTAKAFHGYISNQYQIQCSYETVVMKIKKWTLYDVKMTVFLPSGGTREICYGFQMRSAGIMRSKFSKSKCLVSYNII